MHRAIMIGAGLILSLFSFSFVIPGETGVPASLKGKVITDASGEAIPGAGIYFPGLKRGTVSSSDGTFFIDKLPASQLLVQVSSLGYKTHTATIDLSLTHEMTFTLRKSVTEIGEVVVTGQPDVTEQKRTPVPIGIISQTELFQRPSTNIIDAIAHVPGVSQITTGSGISKPVIRGLGYNRVIVIHQGIRQEGQQWGDEHGTEIDGFGVDHVEIMKGPASLAYGSDAMAGVINLLPAPGAPEGTTRGTLISNYQSNNGLIGYSANLTGNNKGLVWDVRYSGKFAHAFENKYDGPVYNSGFREHGGNAMIGLNRTWGFSRLNFSLYHLKPGMSEGERDSLTGKFIKTVSGIDGDREVPADASDFNSYQPDVPFQRITHYKAVWINRIYLGKSNLQTIIGFQQNHRKEYENPDEYGLYFLLNTFNYDLKYTFPEISNWKLTTGINGMWQHSLNKGSEFLVPDYRLSDLGLFAIVNRKSGKFDFSGGLRFDRRAEEVDALYLNTDEEVVSPEEQGATERFASLSKTFGGFSGSVGATWQISETIHTRANVSRGFRAPNIAELSSNGEHEGTFRYERGNPDLEPESSLQLDWGAGINTEHVSAELSLFHNTVSHYIYSHRLNSVSGGDSLNHELPVFQYTAGKARLTGGEITLDIHPHPLDWLHFENTFSYTRGILKNQPDTARWLPMIPPARWSSVIRTDFARINRMLRHAYLRFGIDYNFDQDHFYAAYGTETRTPAYTLLNLGAGTDFTSGGKTLFSLNISVNNLTNVAYQNHLSRLKYAGMNYNTRRMGIYNMGRNMSFTLRIPVDF